MRPIQILRSRSRSPVQITLDLLQSPHIIYHPSPNLDDEADSVEPSRLPLAVTVTTDDPKWIGGISLVRKVLLKRRIPNSKRWGEYEEVQVQRVEVLGDCVVEGKMRFEVSVELPARLPETRLTHYDKIIHLLTATVHDLAPSYSTSPAQLRLAQLKRAREAQRAPLFISPTTTPTSPSSSARAGRYAPRRLTPIQEDDDSTSGPTEAMGDGVVEDGNMVLDVLAVTRKVFEVVYCPSPQGDVPSLDWGQMLRLSDSGKVYLRAVSDLFVLGSRLDLLVDFQALTPNTTVHAISTKLVQETSTPVKTALPDLDRPSPPPRQSSTSPTRHSGPHPAHPTNRARESRHRPVLSRLSTLWSSFKEKPPLPKSSIIDEYILLTEGEDHVIAPDAEGFRLRDGTHLWRGEAGRAIDSASRTKGIQGHELDEARYIDDAKASHADTIALGTEITERTTSTMRLHRRVRLPSEINAACASSSTLTPVLAKITHRLEVDIIYSVLGQDQLGKTLPRSANGSVTEGNYRLAKGFLAVGLAGCTIIPSSVQPPSYSSAEDLPCSPITFIPGVSGWPYFLRRRGSNDTAHLSIATLETLHPRAPPASAVKQHGVVIRHTRAFRASNGVVIGGKAVFYDEGEVDAFAGKHKREKGECACGLWEGGGGRLGRAVSGSG